MMLMMERVRGDIEWSCEDLLGSGGDGKAAKQSTSLPVDLLWLARGVNT